MSAVAHIDQYKTGLFYSDEFRGDFSWNGYERNVLLRNEGPGAGGTLRFTDVALALGVDDIHDARAVAVADFDNDGDLDLAVNHNSGDPTRGTRVGPVLLRNEIGARRSWLAVELRGTQSNRDGVGALVRLKAGGVEQMRHLSAGSAYASQQSGRLYFGLDEADEVERLAVSWPSGREEIFEHIGARQLVRITEGAGLQELALPKLQTAMLTPEKKTEKRIDGGRP
jgi:hypothetical protein